MLEFLRCVSQYLMRGGVWEWLFHNVVVVAHQFSVPRRESLYNSDEVRNGAV